MWPFKRKKESDGPIPYSTTPSTPPPASSFAPKPSDESRNWAVVVLDKRAGSGSDANLDDVLMTDLQMEREEIGRFYKSQTPFVAVQRVTQKFAENAVRRLALAGVHAKAETMSEPATTPTVSADIPTIVPIAATETISTTGEYSVVLVNTGRKKIQVIKTIREATQLGLKEAKDLAESTPCTILSGVSEAHAQKVVRELLRDEATAEVVHGTGPMPITSPQASFVPPLAQPIATNGWNVVLVDGGNTKIMVIKVIREHLELGLKEAKDLVDQTPSLLVNQVAEAKAHEFARDLQAAGATVQVSPS
ncbi:MAG: ribosomal protein L7/L12 [Anaerolineae bacterium]|nr:ribosomal protein L7/L12 [Anaerolineae bacterium]